MRTRGCALLRVGLTALHDQVGAEAVHGHGVFEARVELGERCARREEHGIRIGKADAIGGRSVGSLDRAHHVVGHVDERAALAEVLGEGARRRACRARRPSTSSSQTRTMRRGRASSGASGISMGPAPGVAIARRAGAASSSPPAPARHERGRDERQRGCLRCVMNSPRASSSMKRRSCGDRRRARRRARARCRVHPSADRRGSRRGALPRLST